MSQQGRILGIGGVFFKSANQQQMKEWYAKHLGLADSGHGVMLPWRDGLYLRCYFIARFHVNMVFEYFSPFSFRNLAGSFCGISLLHSEGSQEEFANLSAEFGSRVSFWEFVWALSQRLYSVNSRAWKPNLRGNSVSVTLNSSRTVTATALACGLPVFSNRCLLR